MKKQFFYLAVSALAFTACTSEDIVEDATVKQNVISFENVVNKLSRAEDITSGNLSQFNVFGFYTVPGDDFSAYEVFKDVLVKRNGVDWYYENTNPELGPLQEIRYWLKGNKYYFYAYNCGNADKLSSQYGTFTLNLNNTDNLTAQERVLIINNYVCDHTHQHDLIYASNVGNNYAGIEAQEQGNAAVALQFRHILSKVNARFTSKFPEEYTAVIKNVAIQNIRNIGNYHPVSQWQNVHRSEDEQGNVEVPYINLSTATKDEEGNPANISVTNGLDNKGQQLAVYTDTGFVLPFGYSGHEEEGKPSTQVYLTFDIDVLNQGNIVYTKSLKAKLNPTWLPGYFYTYNVELSGSSAGMQAIVFTTTTDGDGRVIDWTQEPMIAVGLD